MNLIKILSLLYISTFFASFSLHGQSKYFTRDGNITFNADSPLEKVQAVNNKVNTVIERSTGKIEFSALIKSFMFEKALMQEHFNENYLESDKYPKATFKGKFTNLKDINFDKNGTYNVVAEGILNMHGVDKKITVSGPLKINGNNLNLAADFKVNVSDFNIEIPSLVKDKISKVVSIKVQANYKAL
ncbi:MAG TPA: YceI family protein [Saprospiraceae bacterium]|nr:YceI family protein [Saprospiraceae bacterium]HQW56707.1 YceI family protein [Saprospiraceae bacterium]